MPLSPNTIHVIDELLQRARQQIDTADNMVTAVTLAEDDANDNKGATAATKVVAAVLGSLRMNIVFLQDLLSRLRAEDSIAPTVGMLADEAKSMTEYLDARRDH